MCGVCKGSVCNKENFKIAGRFHNENLSCSQFPSVLQTDKKFVHTKSLKISSTAVVDSL